MKAALYLAALIPFATATAIGKGKGKGRDPLEYTTLIDDFKDGFSVDTATSKWNHFTFGSYVGKDGVATTTRRKGGMLKVVSPGKNPRTGEPAYTLSAPPDGPVSGDIDHVKFLVFANHTSSAGFPGYDTAPGYELSCEAKVGGRTFGTEGHPFGPDEPANDLNLAFFGGVNGDFEKFMILDFAVTNDAIYAFYERLPFGRTPENHYASFSAAVYAGPRKVGQMHRLKVSYDRSAKIVKWFVDDREVWRITRIGYYPPHMESVYIDRGGVEEDVGDLRQLQCGFGTFTLLDGFNPKLGRGLVRLVPQEGYYLNPLAHNSTFGFVDDASTESSRLFGQGAELTVSWVTVSSTKVGKKKGKGNGKGKGN